MHQFHFTLTGLACAALLCCGCRSTQPAPDGQQLFVGDDIAVAQTTAGKVRGFQYDGTGSIVIKPFSIERDTTQIIQ